MDMDMDFATHKKVTLLSDPTPPRPYLNYAPPVPARYFPIFSDAAPPAESESDFWDWSTWQPWAVVGGGVAALGVVAYLLLR